MHNVTEFSLRHIVTSVSLVSRATTITKTNNNAANCNIDLEITSLRLVTMTTIITNNNNNELHSI